MQEIPYEVWAEFKKERSVETRNYILMHYISLVKKVASRLAFTYQNYYELDDLISSGIFGLMDAIEKYDVDKGNKFETYASFRIRGAIIDHIRKQDWLPKSMRQKFKAIEEAYSTLEKKMGKYPDDTEVAEFLGISVGELKKNLADSYSYQIISMDEQIMDVLGGSNEDSDEFFGSLGSPENAYIEKELKERLASAIDRLNEKERLVISLYYYDGLNQREISRVMGLTESRVSQIHSRALMKIKSSLHRENLA